MTESKRALGLAGLERVRSLKSLRKKMTKEGFDPEAIDAELELWNGTKELRGLLDGLGVQEEQKANEDPAQRDIEDKPDRRTWDLTTDQVRELITDEVSSKKPVEAIRILNALEDGENDREGGSRKSVLEVIASARRPLVKRVDNLQVMN